MKLFRKLRLKSIRSEKLRNYLAYALGEVVLVVVGILIALSLNNWNQNKIAKNQAYGVLQQVEEELANDLILLKSKYDGLNGVLDNLNTIHSEQYTDEDLRNLRRNLMLNLDPIEFGNAFKTLKVSGNIHLIEDQNLIIEIDRFYSFTTRNFNFIVAYHKDLNITNIEGRLIHQLELDSTLNFKPEQIKYELNNGNLLSLVRYQYHYLNSINKHLHKTILEQQELLEKTNKELSQYFEY